MPCIVGELKSDCYRSSAGTAENCYRFGCIANRTHESNATLRPKGNSDLSFRGVDGRKESDAFGDTKLVR